MFVFRPKREEGFELNFSEREGGFLMPYCQKILNKCHKKDIFMKNN